MVPLLSWDRSDRAVDDRTGLFVVYRSLWSAVVLGVRLIGAFCEAYVALLTTSHDVVCSAGRH